MLTSIVIPTGGLTFGWGYAGARTAVIPAGTYGSILEVLIALDAAMTAQMAAWTMAATNGFVSITFTAAWTAAWGTTDDALETLLGFAGTETVDGAKTLTATKRHQSGWYAQCGAAHPPVRRTKVRRTQDLDDGTMTAYASEGVHQRVPVTFGLLTPEALDEGGSASDGAGGSVDWTDVTLYDWWQDAASKPFRYYPDGADGTVADPGAEGDEYTTRMLDSDEFAPDQVDPMVETWNAITLPMKIIGS